jgi:hypothetical protein
MTDGFFGDEYGTTVPSSSPQALEMMKQVVAWKARNFTMYPDDVLNMLIDNGLVQTFQVNSQITQQKQSPVDVKLPTSYITE